MQRLVQLRSNFTLGYLLLLVASPALGFLNQEPPPPPVARSELYEEHWFDARLNHFDATNTETFPMRFYYNPVVSGFPNLVIFVGGEWEITPGWVTGGLGLDLAHSMSAALVYTEHRYYGQSRPTNDTSVSQLRFLTVDQALGDLSQFIHHVKSSAFENGRHRNARVALVGCSYAGSMATWMSLSYPHLIDAAFSDSGPLHAQGDFGEYLEVVGETLRAQGGDACYNTVEQAVQQVSDMLDTSNGPAELSQLFGTCTPLSVVPLDRAMFHWNGIILPFGWLVQGALPGSVAAACQQLTNPDIADPLQRLVTWVRSRPSSQPCVETRYTEMVETYTNTSYDAPVATNRVWFYQTCVEYGWYQTTSGTRHPFGSGVPLYYFEQMCRDFYSAAQSPERRDFGISRTNTLFSGRRVPDRVVTVQGQFDPWRPMGPTEANGTFMAPVYEVPGISHCRIIHSMDNSETEAVLAVKVKVLNDMTRFLHGVFPSAAPRVVGSIIVMLGLVLAVV